MEFILLGILTIFFAIMWVITIVALVNSEEHVARLERRVRYLSIFDDMNSISFSASPSPEIEEE